MDKGGNSDHVELCGFRESSTKWDLHLIIKIIPTFGTLVCLLLSL